MTALRQSPRPAAIVWSERLYRALLTIYPRPYRQEYGVHMVRTFRDYQRDQYHRHGLLGLIEVWGPTLIDAVFTAVTEHLAKGVVLVSKETWSRIGGPALMLGGIAWLIASTSQLQPVNDDAFGGPDIILEILAFLLAPALIALLVGVIGLRARLGARAGGVGRGALLFAIAAGFVGIAGMIVMAFPEVEETGWRIFISGFMSFYLGVLIFGISALRIKPLARGNVLPLLIGVIFLGTSVISMFGIGPVQGPDGLDRWLSMGVFFIVGLFWMLLGYNVMAEDRPQAALA